MTNIDLIIIVLYSASQQGFVSALSFYYFTIYIVYYYTHYSQKACTTYFVYLSNKKSERRNMIITKWFIDLVLLLFSGRTQTSHYGLKSKKKWNLEAFEFNWSGPKVEDWRITF